MTGEAITNSTVNRSGGVGVGWGRGSGGGGEGMEGWNDTCCHGGTKSTFTHRLAIKKYIYIKNIYITNKKLQDLVRYGANSPLSRHISGAV